MKKLLSVLLSLTLALSLASCGGTDSASSAAPSASAPSASQEAQGEPSGAAAADLPGSADILLVCEEAAQGAGGVLGSAHDTTVADCTNKGAIRHGGTLGTETVGGIVGLAVDVNLTGCVNEGDVSGDVKPAQTAESAE